MTALDSRVKRKIEERTMKKRIRAKRSKFWQLAQIFQEAVSCEPCASVISKEFGPGDSIKQTMMMLYDEDQKKLKRCWIST